MGYTAPALNAAVNGIAAAGAYISFHTADPGTTGASEMIGTRPATTWAAASGGSRAGSQVTVAVPGGTTITHWGIWSAPTGGTFLYGAALPAPEPFPTAGSILHTPTITVRN